jgi:prepilin-type N-terminal cleavage/methylation domain-containing protein
VRPGKDARPGFTLLEAAVAMAIIGVVSIGALGAFAADLRAASRAQLLLPAAVLARERMSVLELPDAQTIRMLPDSLARGTFAAPFDAYSWRASSKEVRGEPALIELKVGVEWNGGSFGITERRFRPQLATSGAGQ